MSLRLDPRNAVTLQRHAATDTRLASVLAAGRRLATDGKRDGDAGADDDAASKRARDAAPIPLPLGTSDLVTRATVVGTDRVPTEVVMTRAAVKGAWAKDAVFSALPKQAEFGTDAVKVFHGESDVQTAVATIVDTISGLTRSFKGAQTARGTYNSFFLPHLLFMTGGTRTVLNNAIQDLFLKIGYPNSLTKKIGLRRTGYDSRIEMPRRSPQQQTPRYMTEVEQTHNAGVSVDELVLTIFAAENGLAPALFAATLRYDWPIYLVEAGTSLHDLVNSPSSSVDVFTEVGTGLVALYIKASKLGLLVLDSKAANIVIMEYGNKFYPRMIDLDPKFTAVYPDAAGLSASCIFVINTVIFVRQFACTTSKNRSGAELSEILHLLIGPLLRELREVNRAGVSALTTELCKVLQTLTVSNRHVQQYTDLTSAAVMSEVARTVLQLSWWYTEFTGEGRGLSSPNGNCQIKGYDAKKPAWPQIVQNALDIMDQL